MYCSVTGNFAELLSCSLDEQDNHIGFNNTEKIKRKKSILQKFYAN